MPLRGTGTSHYRGMESKRTVPKHATTQEVESVMPDLISSPPFLIIVAIFVIFLVIGITKRGVRFLIWISVIFVILICLGIAKQSDLLNWFENLLKTVKQ